MFHFLEPELNDTYDENNDPEYNFLEETEPIDSEEQRNDKGVKVTSKPPILLCCS